MIVNHTYKFIFLKTRKTAGTSVEIALSRFCGGDDIVTPLYVDDEATRRELGYCAPQNYRIPLRQYEARDWWRALRGKRARLKNHSVAGLVRRILGPEVWESYFKFAIERDPFDKAISRYYWNLRDAQQRGDFYDVLRALPEKELSSFEIYSIDGEVAVDRVLRFERLGDELEEVRKQLGIPEPLELTRAKGSHRPETRHYSEILDARCRALIEGRCAREIETFGYAWRDSPRR